MSETPCAAQPQGGFAPGASYSSWSYPYAAEFESVVFAPPCSMPHEIYPPTVNWWGEDGHRGDWHIEPRHVATEKPAQACHGHEKLRKLDRTSQTSSSDSRRSSGSAGSKACSSSSVSGSKSVERARRAAVPPNVAQDGDRDVGRELFLMRNRQAAERCRAKKKLYEADLQEQALELESDNVGLKEEAMMLKEEILHLKTEYLRHVECECHQIRRYLMDRESGCAARYSVDSSATSSMGSPTPDQIHYWHMR